MTELFAIIFIYKYTSGAYQTQRFDIIISPTSSHTISCKSPIPLQGHSDRIKNTEIL